MLTLGVYTMAIGILNLWGGAARDSRFFALDDVAVRGLGMVFILLGACSLLKARRVLLPLAVVYAVSIAEVFVTKPGLPEIVCAGVFFGLPLWCLIRKLRDTAS